MSQTTYKVIVRIPEDYSEELMDAIDQVIEPLYPGYDRCFSIIRSTGTWRSLEGSDPYNGEIGKITVADELSIEFICRDSEIENVLRTIERIHPYEEPGIDVIPCIGWRSLLH